MIDERRSWPRIKVEWNCVVQVLVSDRNFKPHKVNGCILDLTVGGAKVRIPNFSKEMLHKIVRSTRYARLTFSTAESKRDIMVLGKIIWMNFNNIHKLFDMVLNFENLAPQAEQMLQKIVEQAS